MAGGIASAHKIKLAMRRNRALQLRLEGLDYREISARLQADYPGYTFTTAWRDVSGLLAVQRKKNDEIADQVRQMELARLDALLHAVWKHAQVGSVEHVNAALRVMERRAKLMGLDAPTKTDITSGGDSLVIEYVNDWRSAPALPTLWTNGGTADGAAELPDQCGETLEKNHNGNGHRH